MFSKKLHVIIKFICACLLLATHGCTTQPQPPQPPQLATSQTEILAKQANELDEEVLTLALKAYKEAENRGLVQQSKLTVIDYSLPSNVPRLWVFDLDNNKLLYELHVTHGAKSGLLSATRFSNQHDSHQSSIGVFITQEAYYGRYGYSLRINGVEEGINDNARSRAIVMHGADYATPAYVAANKRLGRSWGCPAIDPQVTASVVEELKQGSMIFAYYPEENWLQQSSFL